MVAQVSGEKFQDEVLRSSTPVLVDFYATWCMPCKMVAPVVEQIARDFQGKLKVVKVDIDESQNLAAQFSIQGVPTFILFKGGQEVARIVGAAGKDEFTRQLSKHIQ